MQKAFDKLVGLVKQIHLHSGFSNSEESIVQQCVKAVANYHRNHFAYSIQFESEILQHCTQFSLSENPNKAENKFANKDSELFCQQCTHTHESTCQFCNLLPATFGVSLEY